MGVRTTEQRLAFPGAKDTSNIDLRKSISKLSSSKTVRIVALCASLSAFALAYRLGWLMSLKSRLPSINQNPVLDMLLFFLSTALAMATGPAMQSVLGRVVTRLIDWGVPAAIILFAVSVIADGDEPAPGEEPSEGGGLLKKLLKGKGDEKSGYAPAKQFVKIESLGDKLSSMAFTIQAETTSKAEASRMQRRRHLARRFGDELGDIGDTALAGIAAAEASWRKKTAAPAAAAAAARSEIRSLSVKLGGNSAPKSTVGGNDRPEQAKLDKSLKQKLKRAEKKLTDALEETFELEASFLQCASESLGDDAWEAREALAKLVTAPVTWDPMDVPLPHNAGLAVGKRAFVLDFEGDSGPAQVASLREEVTAVVNSADPKRGDTVVLRLVSGGGSVTGYGLAMAQLMRLKDAGLHLTICVEQVAASGGYMMACVADKIVASPFAVLGSIGVITQIPNVYERLKKEGVEFATVTAGEFKRTLTPFKKLDRKDVEKTEEEVDEIFTLFKSFVAAQRPQLDIDKIATGETWFGRDAIERNLADSLQTFDDTLIELHTAGVEIYSVTFLKPDESPLAKLGVGSSTSNSAPGNWIARVLAAAIGLPLPHSHATYSGAVPASERQPHFRDPRFSTP